MAKLFFAEYRLDTQKSKLYHQAEALELEPQIYSILELLITRHGELVSRDDMIDAVWDGRMVSNYVIDNRIRAVRAAIGDNGRAQRYIKTYPNLGYKFIGNVRVEEDAKPPQKNVTQNQTANDRQPSRPISPFTTVLAICLVALFGFYIFSQYGPSRGDDQPVNVEASDDQTVDSLAILNDPNDMPRVAVLPFDAIGERSEYGYLAEILESEFSHVITAIEGITVVELSAGILRNEDVTDYKALSRAFDLDFTIASRLSTYGENYKLNVSLVRTEDGKIIQNQAYDLNMPDGDGLENLPAVIASKVTLMVANELNLSTTNLPQSWENYDFYKKIQQAKAIYENGDYESFKSAAELLREVIAEEPNYIPAYSGLINVLGWQADFFIDDFEILLKEQAEFLNKMKEISPEAPETLLVSAIMAAFEAENLEPSEGEYDANDPVSVANYILKKDPDHLFATQTLAWYSEFQLDQAETVKAYENLMNLLPTEATPSVYYSEALFCNKEFSKAQSVLDRVAKWHPGHREILIAEVKRDQALGKYEAALGKIKRLISQGYISDTEAGIFSDVFSDLGYLELILPHIRNPARKVEIYTVMGKKETADKEELGPVTRMIIDVDYIPESYDVTPAYETVGMPGGRTQAYFCRIEHLLRDTYVLKKINSEKYKPFLPLLTDYFKDKAPKDLVTQQEFIALTGLHVLQDDFDGAMDVMDAAMNRGFLFIGELKTPYLKDLAAHPGFAERLEIMQNSADRLINEYYLN